MFFITNPSLLLFCFTNVLFILSTAHGVHWPSAEQEALDELNDYKMLKAVQQSMSEWKSKKSFKHRRKRADKSVCYGDLGCFEDSGPFGYLDMLPTPPEEIGTKFFIYSTKRRSDRPLLEFSWANVSWASGDSYTSPSQNGTAKKIPPTVPDDIKPALNLNALEDLKNVSTRVIVHGFGSSCPHVWIYELRTALMAVENCIVICVDWENGSTLPNYVRAAANTRLVGKQLAMLLKSLRDMKNLEMSRTHIIGFSLGAHVAGFAGAELEGLHRITGLDPAGPLFEAQHPNARLDSTDAEFVDVIHSNGENLILGGLGSWQPMGHVDFYPNGGRVQHGCANIFVGALTDFIWTSPAAAEGRSLCNHRRAYKFFIDSVAPRCLFPAFPCDSYDNFLEGRCFPCDKAIDHSDDANARCGNMGYYADRSTGRGQLYLLTREEEPFCAHQYHVEINSALHDLPLRTLGRLEITFEGEGGLNETFTITEKDDTELFAGDTISRILVPHPALGFPSVVTLTYKSYSGWLSKGLPNWKVYKVMLTDSFGKHSSVCKRFFTLESGKPQRLSLQPGECHIPDATDYIELLGYPEKKNTTKTEKLIDGKRHTIGPTYALDENLSLRNGDSTVDKKEVVGLSSTFKVIKNFTYSLNEEPNTINQEWQPVIDENSLERETTERDTSRSFSTNDEVFEPVLKVTGKRSNNFSARESHALKNIDMEITEPVLRSTTQRHEVSDDDFGNIDHSTENTKRSFDKSTESQKPTNREGGGFITVQLLPFRLGEILDRAERYARLTLLPLITEAPRFFGFDNTSTSSSSKTTGSSQKGTAKYFPTSDDLEADLENESNKVIKVNRKRDGNSKDFIENHFIGGDDDNQRRSSPRNLLDVMRVNRSKILTRPVVQHQQQQYYTNPDEIEDDDDMKVIKISLPTFKPYSFPYPFEIPDFGETNTDDGDDEVGSLPEVNYRGEKKHKSDRKQLKSKTELDGLRGR